MKTLFSLLMIILIVLYPFAVHGFIGRVSPLWFAAILFLVALCRFSVIGASKTISDYFILSITFVFCLSVALINTDQILKFYPVLMNFGMGALFIVSLKSEQSLIEKFAQLAPKKPPPEAKPYLRRLTLAWGVLLIGNGLVSAYTAWYTSTDFWVLYNGVLSYLLIGTFAVSEYIYRGFYKRKNNLIDE